MRHIELPVTEIDIEEQLDQATGSEKLFIDSIRENSSEVETHQEKSNEHNTIQGVVIGIIVQCESPGQLMVDYEGNPFEKPLEAISTSPTENLEPGLVVALLFQNGNPQKPIIVGPVQNVPPSQGQQLDELKPTISFIQTSDNKKIELKADKELVLRCGNASITLTKAGKVIIRGTYLLNRSSGVNRILGGSVQIN